MSRIHLYEHLLQCNAKHWLMLKISNNNENMNTSITTVIIINIHLLSWLTQKYGFHIVVLCFNFPQNKYLWCYLYFSGFYRTIFQYRLVISLYNLKVYWLLIEKKFKKAEKLNHLRCAQNFQLLTKRFSFDEFVELFSTVKSLEGTDAFFIAVYILK